ncbi:MAG TPA: hypothetical protein VF930_09910 [Stellaceae bacterium]
MAQRSDRAIPVLADGDATHRRKSGAYFRGFRDESGLICRCRGLGKD